MQELIAARAKITDMLVNFFIMEPGAAVRPVRIKNYWIVGTVTLTSAHASNSGEK